jgi:hypothetical protein
MQFYKLVVEKDRASAALADDTADVGAGETNIFPEKMRQQDARFDILFVESTVDRHVERGWCLLSR